MSGFDHFDKSPSGSGSATMPHPSLPPLRKGRIDEGEVDPSRLHAYSQYPNLNRVKFSSMHPMEICAVKAGVSGVMGAGMGLVFGFVISSTDPYWMMDTSHIRPSSSVASTLAGGSIHPFAPKVNLPVAAPTPAAVGASSTSTSSPAASISSARPAAAAHVIPSMAPGWADPTDLPWRDQFRTAARHIKTRSVSMAKNFGAVGLVYSGVECVIEKARAKHELSNAMGAGCITGAGFAARAGPQAMAFGCAGFALFSAVIDYYLMSSS